MKFVVVTSANPRAGVIITRLLEEHPTSVSHIFVETHYVRKTKTVFGLLCKLAKRTGWQTALTYALETVYCWLILRAKKLFWRKSARYSTVESAAKRRGIPVEKINHSNDEKFLDKLRAIQPDIIFIIDSGTIVKKPFLNVPRKCTLNFHPGTLPDYRGLHSTFHELNNQEERIGASVHCVTPGIDDGPIVDQITISRDPKKSLVHHNILIMLRSADLIARVVGKILEMDEVRAHPQREPRRPYYSHQTIEQVREFHRKGGTLIRAEDIAFIWKNL